MTDRIYDVAVIGAGSAGLQAAQTLGRMHRSAIVLGTDRYRNDPTAHMHNFLGHDGAPPAELRTAARRVFIASEVQLVSEGLQLQLGRFDHIELLGSGRLDSRSIAAIVEAPADVVVLDFGSAAAGDFAGQLLGSFPAIHIVGIAIGKTSLDMADWAALGVSGFIDDDGAIEDVVAAIMRVTRGEFYGSPRATTALVSELICRIDSRRLPDNARRLTPRETEILRDLERGASNKEIARRLGISAATVKNAGAGARPVSILRSVSAEMPAAAATSVMLRPPRVSRSNRPRRSPRSRSSGVRGVRTMPSF